MQILPTHADPRSETYASNREQNLAAIDKLHRYLAKSRAGGGEKYVKRHLARGKLLPRTRVELLLDRDSPFLELLPLAGLHLGSIVPGGSTIAGIGWVMGTECMLSATDATVLGGAINPTGLQKAGRRGEIALENRLPIIHRTESGGAELPNQAETFGPGGATSPACPTTR